MKKIILISIAALLSTLAFGQRGGISIAYVDTEYILGKMPEYRSAQKQLDDMAQNWQNEIEAKYTELDKKFREFEAERPLLSEKQRIDKEKEILKMENEVKKFENDKFGPNGELFKKREELIKPIQDKVFTAIKQIAKEGAFDFVFDMAGGVVMLVTNPKYDISDEVLTLLGVASKE
jgi:outer membrane protein